MNIVENVIRFLQVAALCLLFVVGLHFILPDTSANLPVLFTKNSVSGMTAEGYLRILSASKDGVFFDAPVQGWLEEKDIPFLLHQMKEKKHAGSVNIVGETPIETKDSSVGNEAYFMLLGIKHGVYPPALRSTDHTLESKEEVLSWALSVCAEKKFPHCPH